MTSMGSILATGVILATTISIHVAITAPTRTPPKKDRLRADYNLPLFVCLRVLKVSIWIHAAIELILVFTNSVAPNTTGTKSLHDFLLMNRQSNQRITIYIPPARALSALVIIAAGYIRWLTYREMGRQFTYHITLLKEHRLIKTGPYSYVRHPGYTSGGLVQIFLVFWYTGRGSWLRESDVFTSPLGWLVVALCLSSVVLTLKLYVSRVDVEDELMRKEFGRQWDDWARDVPYRIIPGFF